MSTTAINGQICDEGEGARGTCPQCASPEWLFQNVSESGEPFGAFYLPDHFVFLKPWPKAKS